MRPDIANKKFYQSNKSILKQNLALFKENQFLIKQYNMFKKGVEENSLLRWKSQGMEICFEIYSSMDNSITIPR
jgi:hypothetical protein